MKSAALVLSYAGRCDQQDQLLRPHFLEACSFCSKTLDHTTDIYMYRGNTPFCSQECRQEQIGIDEAKEKRSSSSSSCTIIRASKKQTSSEIKKSTTYHYY